MSLSFVGRNVVVTGAGGGLGRAYAIEFARRGAKVFVNDVGSGNVDGSGGQSETAATAVVREIVSKGGKAVANYNNVATEGTALIESALKEFGSVDVLVNNAGILRDKSFHKLSKKDWTDVMDVHLTGTFSLCHAVWPHMQNRNYGRIVNIGSGAGLYGNFGQANYSAAKMGILGLTQVLAKEGEKFNINVNCLVPVAGSRMTATVMPPAILEMLDPVHVAPLAAFLAHESTSVSGSTFEVGGGWYSQVRLQRSAGAALGTAARPATAEGIAAGFSRLASFEGHVSYPKGPADALRDMMAAASGEVSASTEHLSPSSTSASITASASASAEPDTATIASLKSTQLLSNLVVRLGSDKQVATVLRSTLKSYIVTFEITDSKESSRILTKWLLDASQQQQPLPRVERFTLEAFRALGVKPACTIRCNDETFAKLASGALSTEWAYAQGSLGVEGSMGVALKLKQVLDLLR